MEVRYTRDLVKPENFNWKVLVIGAPGTGKTTWAATAPNVGIAACETGEGSGTLSIKDPDVAFVEPKVFTDFRSICYDTFEPFKNKRTVVLDSLTYMTKTFIKDHVLTAFPAKNTREAMRRQAGVPSGFDYGDIAEVTRNLVHALLSQKKHIIVTALAKTEKDDSGSIIAIGPDLPGALFNGASGMFDLVLHLKTRKILLDPRDPKSAFVQRYFITGNDGIHLAKNRIHGLAPEEIFDDKTGQGNFPTLLKKVLSSFAAAAPASGTNATTQVVAAAKQ